MDDPVLAERLGAVVGQENVSTDTADLRCYSYDASGLTYLPDAVVLPGSSEEVSRVLRLAYGADCPVIARGAGTGTTGASVPLRGGLVLALTRMDRILAIRAEDLVAEVEPGVVTGDLQEAVACYGLFYPPDPASLGFCTIGGNVATGAGGARAVKYGVTRDYVLGLEVVLSTGEVLQTGVGTAKGVVGYDLTRLFVGSEGTLGVVTRVTLRLIPQPEAVGTLLAFFSSPVSASAAVTELLQARIQPRCAEFLDQKSLGCIAQDLPVSLLPSNAGAMLLLEVDGPREAISGQVKKVRDCCQDHGALSIHVASDEQEAQTFWAARRGLSPALRRLGKPHRISEDICVPRSKLPDMVCEIESLGKQHQIAMLAFGHAGDGNLHVHILFDRDAAREQQSADAAVAGLMQKTLALGGTISGEHGVGVTKGPFIGLELDPVGLKLMRDIKALFDPKGILNPGKIFPPE